MEYNIIIINLFELLTQHIPETLAFSFTGSVFLKTQIKKKPVLIIGFGSGFLIFFLRKLPMTFGFHTFISIFLITIMFYYFYDKSGLDCFVAVLKTMLLLGILEIIFSYIFMYLLQINLDNIHQNTFLKTLVISPQNITLFLVGWGLNKHHLRKESEER